MTADAFPDPTIRELSVFLARGKIPPHAGVHFGLVRIPTPTAAVIDRDILERIEGEARENSVAVANLPILHLAVPKMINRALHPARSAADRIVTRSGPVQI